MQLIDLNDFSSDELKAIWISLNSYQWDSRLGEKPKRFDKLPTTNKPFKKGKHNYVYPIMQEIVTIIGKRVIIEYLKDYQ